MQNHYFQLILSKTHAFNLAISIVDGTLSLTYLKFQEILSPSFLTVNRGFQLECGNTFIRIILILILSRARVQLSSTSVRIVSTDNFSNTRSSLFEPWSIITDPKTLHLQSILLNSNSKTDKLSQEFGLNWPNMAIFNQFLQSNLGKLALLTIFFVDIKFGYRKT